MRLIFLPFFFLVSFGGFSQTIISGYLQDSLTLEPLAFATITVKNKAEPAFVKGEITDDKGRFSISIFEKNSYDFKVDYIGYKTKLIKINLNQSSGKLNLGAIGLSALTQQLESVTIVGSKPTFFATIEKQVYNADQYEIARGGTALDVLKNIPSVSTNGTGEITVRGSKGFLILINGKPTQVDAATILGQIPANTIEKVEFITAPSAKYDADGKAGILNIITKKGTANGWTINSNFQQGLPRFQEYENSTEPKRFGSDFSLDYRKRNWDFTSAFNYLKNDIAGQREGEVNTTRNGVFTSLSSKGERSYKRENYGLRASLTYKPFVRDELTAGMYVGKKSQFRTADIFYSNFRKKIPSNEIFSRNNYFNANLVSKSGTFNVYNFNYNHTSKKESILNLSFLYENALLDGYTKNNNLSASNYKDTLQYTFNTGQNPLKAFRFKLDYEKQIKAGKFSAGYQYRLQQQKGSFTYFENLGNNTPLLENPDFSANINVFNNIHGTYLQITGVHKKLEYTSGLRYENAFRKLTGAVSSLPFTLKLSNFFPSLNILYNLNPDFKWKIAHSRRVQRSTNNELNPYPEREHSETLEQGDPNIKPEFIGVYETGIIKDFKKGKGLVYWNIYRQQITDLVNRVNSVYNDTILNRVYTNAGKAQLTGTELGLSLNPSKKFKFLLGGNLYKLKINGSVFDNTVKVNSSGWVYSLNSTISYQFTTSFNGQFNINYLSARNTAQGVDSRFYQPNFSLKKKFKFPVTAAVQWQNAALFGMKVNEQRISTSGNNFYTSTNYIQERNIVLLNISYSFNVTNKKAKLPSSEFGEREF